MADSQPGKGVGSLEQLFSEVTRALSALESLGTFVPFSGQLNQTSWQSHGIHIFPSLTKLFFW